MRKLSILLACVILLWMLAPALTNIVKAQVPVAVWGYVYMPDGSPAAGASVSISGGGASASTSTGNDGKYGPVTLTVSSTPVTITVKASKGSYSGSASKTGEGTMRIDVHLKAAPPPTPTPSPPPPEKRSTSLRIEASKEEYVNEPVVLTGSISPAMSVEITIVVTKPDDSTLQARVNTDSQGRFRYEFTTDVLGLYRAYAQFAGNNEYKSSTSNTVEFYVKTRPTVDLYALASGPRQVRLGGSVRPAPEIIATIMIFVSLDSGSSWLHLSNTTTDSEGRFTIDLRMSISGELLFKAVFTGTARLARAESTRPLAFRLVGEEEEQLNEQLEEMINELRRLEEENRQLRANITQLESNMSSLLNRFNEALEDLRGLEEAASRYKDEAERYGSEASQYRMLAMIGIPVSLAAGLAMGTVLGRKLRGREQAS
ncbi:MAG: hypothetical protein QW503_06740 [Sulfolobales archaeon]